MAEKTFDAAIAFRIQSAYGTYHTGLNGISTSLDDDQGLILGDPASGVGESGISLSINRVEHERPDFAGSYTKQLGSFIKSEVASFSFTFPFCGNREDTTSTPVDEDFPAIIGIDALLHGAGFLGAADASNVAWKYSPRALATIVPISALVFISGNRYQFQDCFVSNLAINYTPGEIPLATATIDVGEIESWSADDVPATLTYGLQATISAPMVETTGFSYGNARSFTAKTLTCGLELERVPDSNSATGDRLRPNGRTVAVSGTDRMTTADETFDRDALLADAIGDLQLSQWTIGDAATGDDPALAHKVIMSFIEMQSASFEKTGNVVATSSDLVAKGSGAGDNEIAFQFF